MAEQNQIYECEICGNVISVIEAGAGELICCEQPMTLLREKTTEQEGKEKHVPVIENIEGGVRVKVGSIPHPMEDKHFIELIQNPLLILPSSNLCLASSSCLLYAFMIPRQI